MEYLLADPANYSVFYPVQISTDRVTLIKAFCVSVCACVFVCVHFIEGGDMSVVHFYQPLN